MSRHRSNSKKAPPDIGLHMECVEEELEPSQIAYYNKAEKEYNEVQTKLENYVKKMKAEVVERGENCTVLQIHVNPNQVSLGSPTQIAASAGKNQRQGVQATQNYQQMVGQGIITRSATNSSGNTYLVMDPRLGFVVGQVQPPNVPTEAPAPAPTPPSKSAGTRGRPPGLGSTSSSSSASASTSSSSPVTVTTRAKSGLKKHTTVLNEPDMLTPPLTRTRDKAKNQQSQTSPQVQQQQLFSSSAPSVTSGGYKVKVNAKPLPAPTKPGETSAIGGLSAGSKTPWKPNVDDSSSKSTADSREVVFNKVAGKTFPSLVVVARPHLKVKFIPQTTAAQERSALDAKVKGVLMYSSTKLIEWLIQQGLIRNEQICPTHVNNDLTPVKLKLGMYSDVSKFPYSGGYVWISDCCPSQFVSVFSGSIFEGAPHPPTTLLKLIYHWACQTNVQNVVQWVKVDNLYLKNFYTNMRAVCTQAVHEKYKKMGGPRKKIEVGVISLGTTSQDGNRRQVKVEVLGVMDQESKLVRLRAVEPLSDERSFKRRFVKILEPLEEWVHKESAILTDFTVAKAALHSMGFLTVFQVTNESKYSNQNVMEYLRRIVPRMFQNTLSLLSRQIIQQFLDELVWRELWGPIPSQAFNNIVVHIAEQTKLFASESFLSRLSKVSSNPFKRWDYPVWKTISSTRTAAKTQQRISKTPPASTSQESVSDVSFDSSEGGKGIRTRKRAAEQPLSETVASPVAAKKLPKIAIKEKAKKDEKAIKKEKEPTDKLPDEVVKFFNEGKQIPLNTYYYGTREGDTDSSCAGNGLFNVKCCVCNRKFTENIILMKHMILHCQTEPALSVNLKRVHQCCHCFLGFNTAIALKTHMEEIHFIVNNKMECNLVCHICEDKFKTKNDLLYHMHRTHVELELPYECGVCRFRTSIYKIFVDHFIEAHKGEEHVFCPYCLKVVSFSYKGEVITLNVLFYMSHLEKHQRLTLIKDCNRCQLSFIHKGIWDQHLEADHGSWKTEGGVEPILDLPGGIMMPIPGDLVKPVLAVKTQKSPKLKNLFSVTKFKALEIYGLEDSMTCLECESFLTTNEHFTGNFNCLKCQFASCCERAMLEHSAIFHESSNLQFTKGNPTVLSQEIYCVCGYSTSSGNRIAKHLAICERKSAYSSKELAAAAVQSPSRNSIEDVSMQSEGQNVLNMLGLVRKSPEATPANSESMKMEVDQEKLTIEPDVKHEKLEDVQISENVSEPEESQISPMEMSIAPELELLPKNEDSENKIDDEKSEEMNVKSLTEEVSISSEESSTDQQLTVVENETTLIDKETPLEVIIDKQTEIENAKDPEKIHELEKEPMNVEETTKQNREEKAENEMKKDNFQRNKEKEEVIHEVRQVHTSVGIQKDFANSNLKVDISFSVVENEDISTNKNIDRNVMKEMETKRLHEKKESIECDEHKNNDDSDIVTPNTECSEIMKEQSAEK